MDELQHSDGEPGPPAEPAARDAPAPVTALVPGWVGPTFLVLALLLLPWTFWLSLTLPRRHAFWHWNLAWVGFDLMLAAALAATAISAFRRSPWLLFFAGAAATLLVSDAWFDVMTARPGDQLAIAAGRAALVELPLALVSLGIVRQAQRLIARTPGYLERERRRLRRSFRLGPPRPRPDRRG